MRVQGAKVNSLREEKGDLGQGGGKEGREGRRGEVSKLRGVVCSPLPPRPSPVTFSSSVTVTATSGSPAGASPTLVRFNSFLSSVPVDESNVF